MTTMNAIINFFGTDYNVTIKRDSFYREGKGMVVALVENDGTPFACISVNLPPHTAALPVNTFYCKDWSENATIIPQLEEQGLIKPRLDIEPRATGFVCARAYEVTVK
jgi:hypothetical protein